MQLRQLACSAQRGMLGCSTTQSAYQRMPDIKWLEPMHSFYDHLSAAFAAPALTDLIPTLQCDLKK